MSGVFECPATYGSYDDDHYMVTEASTMRFPPGAWPRVIRMCGMLYVRQSLQRGPQGEIACAMYHNTSPFADWRTIKVCKG